MKKFDSEAAKKEFKSLCTKVLPEIRNIEQALAEAGITEGAVIRIGNEGYMSFDVYGSRWSMARYENGGTVGISYNYSESICMPDSMEQEG